MLERWTAPAVWLVTVVAACGGDEECAWGVDALLSEAGVDTEARMRCGDLGWFG